MLDLLRTLRGITATPGRGCTRIAYGDHECEAHDAVWDHLRNIPGLARVTDAAGNTFIVPEARIGDDTPVLLVGSHVDTVIEGGWLDGTLGVAAGAHALGAVSADVRDRIGLVIFRDEEGVRFDSGLFGSKVFAGRCTPADLDVVDGDGVAVRDVVPDPGGCLEYTPPVRPRAYLECHIEQGGRLLAADRRVGVVSGIVGIRRYDVTAVGEANHAGTTEMHRRIDALIPIAELVHRVPDLVRGVEDAVATVGKMRVEPGAANVVPGRATAAVELRAAADASLDRLEAALHALVRDVTEARPSAQRPTVHVERIMAAAPSPTDGRLRDGLVEVLAERGEPYQVLPSMAGHDAQFAGLRCPAGMFFIPSLDARSHHPDEDSREEDILLAGAVMTAWATHTLAECS